MAALPSPTQVAGSHFQLYEAYYHQVDPTNHGTIAAIDAAKFLKKSGLSDTILRDIWDLSDPNGKGFLTKLGFFVALKLVSLAQAGKEISTANITFDAPPPVMGDASVMNNLSYPAAIPAVAKAGDWAMKPAEKIKYDQLYELMKPVNGMVAGPKVHKLLIDSRLPTDALSKIWDLADMDKDGSFDRHEFTVAMHLVYRALEKNAIPDVLPPELLPPTKRDSISISGLPPNAVPVLPAMPALIKKEPELMKPPVPASVATVPWVILPEEKARFDELFMHSDIDKDGFVSGGEIKDVFLKSGVPQEVLAEIWNLCDTGQQGKLNSEQFALAMWLINRKLKGFDPPKILPPEMVPPSCRSKAQNELATTAPPINPEIEMIAKDLEGLAREKMNLEIEICQKEAEVQIKSGEIKSLQGELDALSATLKQLEHQRGEAQNRLNDLRNQRALVESELADVNLELKAEEAQVDKLRNQAEEQETMLKSQEAELSSKKQELEGLKNEENRLEQQQNEFKHKLDSINSNLQESQLQISQVKAKVSVLEETQRQMKDAIALAESAIASGDASGISDSSLSIEPEFRDPSYTRLLKQETSQKNVFQDNKDAFDSSRTKNDDSSNSVAFKTDPFASSADPFSSNDPFSRFSNKPADGFSSDPFNSFGGGSKASNKTDPFGDTSRAGAKTPADLTDKDAFGCDPFAILHAPTAATLATHPSSAPPRPESPSPALPPKKSKQPPPRPAPPRPAQQPTNTHPTTTNDPFAAPFGSNNNSIGEFADFSNFNNKFSDSSSTLSRMSSVSSSLNRTTCLEFTEDPFRDYRYEDPFSIADPFEDTDSSVDVPSKPSHNKLFSSSNNNNNSFDAFGMSFNDSVFENNNINKQLNGSGALSDNSPLPSEEEQLAWAAADSLRLEDERKKQSAQLKADIELAMKLSKGTTKKKKFFS